MDTSSESSNGAAPSSSGSAGSNGSAPATSAVPGGGGADGLVGSIGRGVRPRRGATAATVTTTSTESSGGAAGSQEAPVRWAVLFTGSTATADYEPAGSAGESPDLVEEVARMCVAFHPHNDIRLFPRDRAVTLFWRAQTGAADFVVTRITTAPNPEGTRTALEYVSLLFSPEEFARRLGNDPFRAHTLGLFDRVRDAFLAGGREPIAVALGAADTTARPAPASFVAVFPPNESLATPENIKAVEEYAGRVASGGGVPPTFATWWASRGAVPPGYFEVVLRASAPQAMSLREATEAATALGSTTKASLPAIPPGDTVSASLAASILANADAIPAAIGAAAERVNSEGPDEFRERLSDAGIKASQAGSDLSSLGQRLAASGAAPATRLAELSAQYVSLSQELIKIRHPNPFGVRKTPPTDTRLSRGAAPAALAATPPPAAPAPAAAAPAPVSAAPAAAVMTPEPVATFSAPPVEGNGSRPAATAAPAMPVRKSGSPLLPAAAVAAVGIIAVAVWKLGSHSGGADSGATHTAAAPPAKAPQVHAIAAAPKPHPAASVPAAAGTEVATAAEPKPAAPKPVDLLQRYQTEASPLAAAKARTAATLRASSGKGKAPSESSLDDIAVKAVHDAYKETLPPADFTRVFGGSGSWDYARYEDAVPNVVSAARKAASSGAAEAVAQIKKQQEAVAAAAAAAATPAPERTPEPERTPRAVAERHPRSAENTGETETHRVRPRPSVAAASSHPKPASHETKSAGSTSGGGGGGGEGSAASVGL